MDELNNRYQNFTMLISSIYRNIMRIKDKEMSAIGLKGVHVTCLFYLYTYGEKTAAQLCKISGEDKAAISRSVDFLITEGYICAGSKNYRCPLALTPKGEETARRINDRTNSFVTSASQSLNKQELMTFYKALIEIESNLRQSAE